MTRRQLLAMAADEIQTLEAACDHLRVELLACRRDIEALQQLVTPEHGRHEHLEAYP